MYNLILNYILDWCRPTQLKNSSSCLNLFRSSPCFPTMFMIFLFALFKKFSYFFTKDIPSFTFFAFFTSSFRFKCSSSTTSNIDDCNSFLIISGVFFSFVFLATPRNYKLRKVLLKPNRRFTKCCQINFTFRSWFCIPYQPMIPFGVFKI